MKALTLLLLLATTFLGACNNKRVGSNLIAGTHKNYNQAISSVQHRELLLNLVRRRYLEPVQFTSLGTISQSRAVSKDINGDVSFAIGRSGGIGANASVEDFPTYNLTPQNGPAATRALHSHIPLSVISNMDRAGYPLNLTLSLIGENVAGNRSFSVDASGEIRGGSGQFVTLVTALSYLDKADKVSVSNAIWQEKLFEHSFAPEVFTPTEIAASQAANFKYTPTNEGESFFVTSQTPQPVLWMDPHYSGSGPGREILSLLRIDPGHNKKGWALRNYNFVNGVETTDAGGVKNYVKIQTRSIYGVLNMLSLGVEIPESDYGTTYSTSKYNTAVSCGRVVDIPSKFKIYFSEDAPEGAFVMVPYRHGYYYIKDNDRSSKQYFSALYDIYNLAGPEPAEDGGESPITNSFSVR